MKYFITILLSLVGPIGNLEEPTYSQIMKNKKTMNYVYSKKLSELINQASANFNVSPKLYAAILMQESSYILSAVACKKTCDYGISQINELTAKRYGFDKKKLTTDLKYSVFAGAEVLSWFEKKFAHKEKKWWCRYNVGTASIKKIKKNCEIYIKYVERYMK